MSPAPILPPEESHRAGIPQIMALEARITGGRVAVHVDPLRDLRDTRIATAYAEGLARGRRER